MANNTTIQRRTQETAAARTTEGPTMQQYIKQMQGEIKKALPSVMTPERFSRIVLSALSTNPKLAETSPQSFLGAMMTAAQLGMEPNTPLGQAYLIPFWNSKARALECQFQLGYKGLIDLAYRSGDVSTIMAQVVYENDEFEYSFGLEPNWYTGQPWRSEAIRSSYMPCSAPRMGGTDMKSCRLLMSGPTPRSIARHSIPAPGRRTSRRWQKDRSQTGPEVCPPEV